ncbi:MAG: hypothetical protein K1X89_24860 [Myxococcaceae bacterium]|nr:hypothetical protein [Myxococcaceae bacterium]
MRTTLALALLLPVLSLAAARPVPLPTEVYFLSPPNLARVNDAVQAVPNNPEAVFYCQQWYWLQRRGTWFRTRSSAGGWAIAEKKDVPRELTRLNVSQYRKWTPGAPVAGREAPHLASSKKR